MRHWRANKLLRLILELLSQGITPHKLALTIALGAVLGVTPVLGSTTVLCTLAALALGLNLPLIQLVNYLMYPLQLLLVLPFIQAGQWVFREPPLPFSISQIATLIHHGLWRALVTLWDYTLHGLVAWLVLGAITCAGIYFVLLLILKRFVPKQGIHMHGPLSGEVSK